MRYTTIEKVTKSVTIVQECDKYQNATGNLDLRKLETKSSLFATGVGLIVVTGATIGKQMIAGSTNAEP